MRDLLVRMLRQRNVDLQQEFQRAQAEFMKLAGQLKEAESLLNTVLSMDDPEKEVVADEHNEEGA